MSSKKTKPCTNCCGTGTKVHQRTGEKSKCNVCNGNGFITVNIPLRDHKGDKKKHL